MIGLTILVVIALYWWLASTIVGKVYVKTQSITKKRIAIAIFILIPTWDVILGFPIYAYLCMTQSGTKIYKTVDNVEGFYVGEKSIRSEPIEPYEGYKFVDYQEVKHQKPTGKYYRSYWVDYFKNREMTKLCVYPPHPKSLHHPYTKAFKQGKCIAKEEIAESEVSQWKLEGYKIGSETRIPIFNIHRVVSFQLIDRKTNAVAGELIEYSWGGGWVRDSLRYFTKIAGFGCSGVGKLQDEDLYTKILKPRKGEN